VEEKKKVGLKKPSSHGKKTKAQGGEGEEPIDRASAIKKGGGKGFEQGGKGGEAQSKKQQKRIKFP